MPTSYTPSMMNEEFWLYATISGAQADKTIFDGDCVLHHIEVMDVGGASSLIEVYDGTVSAGTRISRVDGTSTTPRLYRGRCVDGLHDKVTNADGALRAIVWYSK
jgi:hypothetical protein